MHHSQMSVKPLYESASAPQDRAPALAPAKVLGFPWPPKALASLRRNECRFCVVDAPAGEMHLALFCAAPAAHRPYCAPHSQRCVQDVEIDLEALAVEIE